MQGEQVIIGLLVYRLTGSSAWVGISLAIFFTPMLLVGVPAGALADRYDKRRVLIFTELALMTLLCAFGALLVMGKAALTAALIMSVLSGTLRSVHHPARLSFTGEISGKNGLVAALGLLSVVSRLGQLIGAVFTGAVALHLGDGIAYLILGLGHALALWCFIMTRSQSATARAAGGLCGALLLSALLVRRLGTFYLGIFCGFGIALIGLGLAPQLKPVLFAIALVAVFASVSDILIQSMLQLCVPEAASGRAMGAWVVALGVGPLGHLALGWLISLFGTTAALVANGMLMIGLAALLLGSSVMKIRNPV